jgi:hypothetical protein
LNCGHLTFSTHLFLFLLLDVIIYYKIIFVGKKIVVFFFKFPRTVEKVLEVSILRVYKGGTTEVQTGCEVCLPKTGTGHDFEAWHRTGRLDQDSSQAR